MEHTSLKTLEDIRAYAQAQVTPANCDNSWIYFIRLSVTLRITLWMLMITLLFTVIITSAYQWDKTQAYVPIEIRGYVEASVFELQRILGPTHVVETYAYIFAGFAFLCFSVFTSAFNRTQKSTANIQDELIKHFTDELAESIINEYFIHNDENRSLLELSASMLTEDPKEAPSAEAYRKACAVQRQLAGVVKYDVAYLHAHMRHSSILMSQMGQYDAQVKDPQLQEPTPAADTAKAAIDKKIMHKLLKKALHEFAEAIDMPTLNEEDVELTDQVEAKPLHLVEKKSQSTADDTSGHTHNEPPILTERATDNDTPHAQHN